MNEAPSKKNNHMMLQSIVRYLIAYGLAYLVGHGVITKVIADQNIAALTNYAVIVLGILGTIVWSFLEKDYKGVLDKYFPAPGKGLTTAGGETPRPGPGTAGGGDVPAKDFSPAKTPTQDPYTK